MKPKIVPFLWFNDNLEEAVEFYKGIFKNIQVMNMKRSGDEGPGPKGTVFSATFEIEGQTFYAINGGSRFQFSQAVSFFVNCDSQDEIDHLWERLSEGGEKQMCGWLKDKFGLSWQIVPGNLGALLGHFDTEKSMAVMQAMLQMDKLDMNVLEAAFNTNGDL